MKQINHKVIDDACEFTIDIRGEIHGLVDGVMRFEPTGIMINDLALKIWKLGVDAWGERMQEANPVSKSNSKAKNKTAKTKIERAIEIYSRNNDKSRKEIIAMFCDQLGMTASDASTYYTNVKKKGG